MGSSARWDGPVLKRVNIARCATFLRDHGPATVTGIATGTGLSRPTVDGALTALAEKGLVEPAADGEAARSAGRPARRFRFRGGSLHVVGVDVGVHHIRVVLSTIDGRAVAFRVAECPGSIDGVERLRIVMGEIDSALEQAGAPRATLAAIGFAITGLVDEHGTILLSHNLPDWEGTSVSERVRAEFGCPVTIDNDVRLAALAEHRLGAARLADDVAYFVAGHRVSMGLMIGGEIRRGSHSAAGEIGDVAFGTRTSSGGELIWTSAPSGAEVFRLAADGDEAAQQEVEDFAMGLARGIALMSLAIDPDVVIIGGGMSRAGEQLIGPLRRAIRRIIHIPVEMTVLASTLGSEAVVMGAVLQALGVASETLFEVDGLPEPALDYRLVAAGEAERNAA
jgi:predicted NBD/HSP70 family sugar kinase